MRDQLKALESRHRRCLSERRIPVSGFKCCIEQTRYHKRDFRRREWTLSIIIDLLLRFHFIGFSHKRLPRRSKYKMLFNTLRSTNEAA